MKKKYTITIDETMIIDTVNVKRFIIDNIKPGEKTIASVIAKQLDRNKKRISEALNQLEEEGFFTSEDQLIKFDNGSAWCKVFTRV